MSVSEASSMDRSAQQHFTIASAIGGTSLLIGLAFILGLLPWTWEEGWQTAFANTVDLKKNAFLSGALLVLVELLVVGVLTYFAFQALQKQTEPGVRAGMFFFAIFLFKAKLFEPC